MQEVPGSNPGTDPSDVIFGVSCVVCGLRLFCVCDGMPGMMVRAGWVGEMGEWVERAGLGSARDVGDIVCVSQKFSQRSHRLE